MASDKDLPTAKRRRLDFSQEVTVIVGEDQQYFTVPKCFLTKTSNYFDACVYKSQQIDLKPIKLPSVNPSLFSIYLQWLYTGILVTGHGSEDDLGSRAPSVSIGFHLFWLTRLWRLAVMVDDKALANDVIDATITAADGINILDQRLLLEALQSHVSKTCGLYRVVLDIIAKSGSLEYIDESKGSLSKDFLVEIIKTLMRGWKNEDQSPAASLASPCLSYHLHDEKTPICATEQRSDGRRGKALKEKKA